MKPATSRWVLGGLWLLGAACAVAPSVVRTGGAAVIRRPDRRLEALRLGPAQGGALPRLPVGTADGLVQDGDAAWLLEGSTLFRYEPSRSTWVEEGPAVVTRRCLALVPTARGPVCVGPDRVFRPGDGARWDAPSLDGFALKGLLRQGFHGEPLVAAGHGETVVVGTNHGEWGSVLWFLDTRTGAWTARQFSEEVQGLVWWQGGWLGAWTGVGESLLRTLDLEGKVLAVGPASPAPICSLAVDPSASLAAALSAGAPVTVGASLELVAPGPRSPDGGPRAYLNQDGWCGTAGALLVTGSGPALEVDGEGRVRRLDPAPAR